SVVFIFFFQAEDGIRDFHVTGVQTCALPICITVTIRNRNEEAQEAIRVSSRLVAGEVMGDVSQDVTRSLSLGLVDPEGKLRFEGRSPARGAVFADRFVSVEYGVFVPELDEWVDVPVFWGPVTDFSRSGHLVTIEAQG